MMRRTEGRFKEFFLTIPLTCILAWLSFPVQAETVTCQIMVERYNIIDHEKGQEIIVEDFGSLLVPGKPKLPRKIFAVAIPPKTKMKSVSIEASEEILLDGHHAIMPTPLSRVIGSEDPKHLSRDKKIWQRNYEAVYGSDAPYPSNIGEFVRTSAYRKYNLVDVSVTPFSYQPLSEKLSFHPTITIKVEYEELTSGYDLPLIDFHPETESVAKEIILNYEEARSWYPAGHGEEGKELKDFVIVTRQALVEAVSSLIAWEEAKGRHCEVVTVEWIDQQYTGPDRAARIRKFLRDKYPTSEWGIRDVLLVGNRIQVDMRLAWANIPGYDRPRTDFYFAELSLPDEESWDLNGDGHYGEPGVDEVDFYSEVNVGRIPWSDAETVQHICEKSVTYEQNEDPAFKKNILLLGAFFADDTDAAVLMEAKSDQPWMSDWTTTRMYEKNSDYYSDYPCDYELLHSNVINQWSNGMFAFVNWAGHGGPTSSHILGLGMPAFITSPDCSLLNDEYPAIIFGDSCSNCQSFVNIGKDMLKQGAVGFVGATAVALGRQGWDDPSDGSSQSLDYWFTTGVTSGDYTQGASHQRALRRVYTDGGWNYPEYEMYEWSLWGNPDLGLDYSPSSIPLITAPGPAAQNTSDVRVFNALEGDWLLVEFQAYHANKYGTNVAFGDLDNGGEAEIITGPGPGAIFGPHVRAFTLNGNPINRISFLAYGTKKYGTNVGCGDVDGDGFYEILTGAGPGAVFGPHVRGWNYDGGTVTPIHDLNFFAYGTRQFGVNVTCGDVDGDGADEIVTGAGPGAVFGPHVRAWKYNDGTLTPIPSINFLAYPSRHYGVEVGTGDIGGGVNDEIITGPGPGMMLGSNVRAFSCETGRAQLIPGVNFMAYPDNKYGVIVGAGNADDEGKNEMITGPGPGPDNYAHVRGWRFDGNSVMLVPYIDFYAFRSPDYLCGVNVAVGR